MFCWYSGHQSFMVNVRKYHTCNAYKTTHILSPVQMQSLVLPYLHDTLSLTSAEASGFRCMSLWHILTFLHFPWPFLSPSSPPCQLFSHLIYFSLSSSTESHGQIVTTLASYSGALGFTSWPRYRLLSWLRVSVFSWVPPGKCRNSILN
jgi:hypothetical protein